MVETGVVVTLAQGARCEVRYPNMGKGRRWGKDALSYYLNGRTATIVKLGAETADLHVEGGLFEGVDRSLLFPILETMNA